MSRAHRKTRYRDPRRILAALGRLENRALHKVDHTPESMARWYKAVDRLRRFKARLDFRREVGFGDSLPI